MVGSIEKRNHRFQTQQCQKASIGKRKFTQKSGEQNNTHCIGVTS